MPTIPTHLRRFFLTGFLLALSGLGAVADADAALVIANYEFTVAASIPPNVVTTDPSPSSDADPLTLASSASWGSAAGAFHHSSNHAGNGFLIQNKAVVITNTTGAASSENSLAHALTGNWYLGFTVTNNTGAALQLNQLTFNDQFVNAANISTGISVLARVNGGAFTSSDLVQAFNVSFSGVSDGEDVDFGLRTVDMSSFVIPDAASIEVRLYFYDGSTTGHRSRVIDNLELTAVPEPGAGLLGLLALGGLLLRRKRV